MILQLVLECSDFEISYFIISESEIQMIDACESALNLL